MSTDDTPTEPGVTSDIGHYGIVPRWVLTVGLSSRAVHVYALLANCADRTGRSFPSRQWLAKQCDTSLRSIDRVLSELAAANAVTVTQRPGVDGRHNLYHVHQASPVALPLGAKSQQVAVSKAPPVAGRSNSSSEVTKQHPDGAKNGDGSQHLVGRYVDYYRDAHHGQDPPADYTRAAGQQVRKLLQAGEDAHALERCLYFVATESDWRPSNLSRTLSELKRQERI